MTKSEALAQLQQPYRESVLLDGLDDALIGYIDSGHQQPRALYDLEKCVELIRHLLRERSVLSPLQRARTHLLLVLDGWSGDEMKVALPFIRRRHELQISVVIAAQNLGDTIRARR
ncbi:MAG TPA: hypothetical protein VGP72_32320 [Planctomycetota bacterium]|jgi:hypothetical protein